MIAHFLKKCCYWRSYWLSGGCQSKQASWQTELHEKRLNLFNSALFLHHCVHCSTIKLHRLMFWSVTALWILSTQKNWLDSLLYVTVCREHQISSRTNNNHLGHLERNQCPQLDSRALVYYSNQVNLYWWPITLNMWKQVEAEKLLFPHIQCTVEE